MKHNIYQTFRHAAVCVLMCMGIISCQTDGELLVPDFPELQKKTDVVPGEVVEIVFNPNMDWVIQVPEETFGIFWIDADGYRETSFKGKASSEARVRICTSTSESFSVRTCKVTLIMGGKSQVIAEISMVAKNKEIKLSVATIENGEFVSDNNNYIYEDATEDGITMIWSSQEKKYLYPISVDANFQWTVDFPDWVRADISSDSKVGKVNLNLYSVSSELPMNDEMDYIVFKSDSVEIARLKIAIPGSKDVLVINNGGYSDIVYDHAGYQMDANGSFSNFAVYGSLYGPSQVRIFLLSKEDGVYSEVTDWKSFWLNLEVEEWDLTPGSDKLQQREFSYSTSRYYDQQLRECAVVFTPATYEGDWTGVLSSDKTNLADQFAYDALLISQTGRPSEYIVMEKDADVLHRTGVFFERKDEIYIDSLDYVETSQMYELVFSKDLSGSNGSCFLTEPYDDEGFSRYWLDFDDYLDNLYGSFVMNPKKLKEDVTVTDGYVVFKNKDNKAISVVHCIFRKEDHSDEDITEDRSSLFLNPEAADHDGFRLVEVVDGPTYLKYHDQYEAPILRLTCDVVDNNGFIEKSVDIRTSEDIKFYYKPSDMIVVDNDENFSESGGYLLFDWGDIWTDSNENGEVDRGEVTQGYRDRYDGITNIIFRRTPENDAAQTRTLVQLFNTSDEIAYYIICCSR